MDGEDIPPLMEQRERRGDGEGGEPDRGRIRIGGPRRRIPCQGRSRIGGRFVGAGDLDAVQEGDEPVVVADAERQELEIVEVVVGDGEGEAEVARLVGAKHGVAG